jgi:hypothetical protein
VSLRRAPWQDQRCRRRRGRLRSAFAVRGLCVLRPLPVLRAVGEFRKLAMLAEADGHLRQKLQQVLKLSKEKWDDARDHAMRAVVADNRIRIWYADKTIMETGLLFTCRLGNIDLDRPIGARGLQRQALAPFFKYKNV